MSNQNIDARILAHRILQSLCDSSLATEFQEFRFEVQQELNLTDEEMKFYDFQNIVELLRPVPLPRRHFKGREVRREVPPAEPSVEPPSEPVYPRIVSARDVEEVKVTVPEVPVVVPETAQAVVATPVTVPETAPTQEDTDSDQTEKKKHPATKALRKLLRNTGVPLSGLRMDTDTHKNALMLYGNTKQHTSILSSLGGYWSQRAGCWVFSKEKLTNAAETARRQSEEAPVKPVPVAQTETAEEQNDG